MHTLSSWIDLASKSLLLVGMALSVSTYPSMRRQVGKLHKVHERFRIANAKYLSRMYKRNAVEEVALSVTYVNRVLIRDSTLAWFLIAVSACYWVASIFLHWLQTALLLFPVLVIVLLIARSVLLQYRIKNGLFGTSEHEAREIIGFILNNSNTIDFTDGDGKLRKALLPEVEAEGITAGVRGGAQA